MKLVHFIPSKRGRFFKVGFVLNTETQDFLDATGIVDTDIIGALDGVLVSGLKNTMGWENYVGLYPIVGNTFDQHKFNLINPATYILTASGSLTHSVNGVSSNGGFLNTGIIPTTHLSASDTHLSFYSRTVNAPAGTFAEIGSYSSGTVPYNINRLVIRWTSSFIYGEQGTSNSHADSNTRTHGLFLSSRDNSLNYIIKTPIADFTQNHPYNSNSNRSITILGHNTNQGNANPSNKQCALASIGFGINSLTNEYYTIVNNFQTALGRAV